MNPPPPAVGSLTPVWPILDLAPRFKPDSFMRARGSGRPRFHAGMDLPAPRGAVVVATEPGTVVKTQTFNGPHAYALLLETDTGLVVNYGEVEPDSWHSFGVDVGTRVEEGEPIATVGINPGGSTMIHLETYRAGTRKTSPWYQDEGPPPSLLDPTDYVLRAALRPVTSEGLPPLPPQPKPPPEHKPPPPPAAPPAPAPAPPASGGGGWILLPLLTWFMRRRSRRADP